MRNYVESFDSLVSLDAFLNKLDYAGFNGIKYNPVKRIFKADGKFFVWYIAERPKDNEVKI